MGPEPTFTSPESRCQRAAHCRKQRRKKYLKATKTGLTQGESSKRIKIQHLRANSTGSTEKRVTQKGEKSCLRVTKTDSTEVAHNNRNKPRGHHQRLHKMRASKKGSRMKPEVESPKNEGQKAKPMQIKTKTPQHIAICLGHM